MTEPEALRREVALMIEKSSRTLQAAQRDFKEGDFDFASSKAYYAIFHLMQAVLLTKGLSYSKHAGVISGFSEHFIKSGQFPPDWGSRIQRLRKDREVGDYGYALRVSRQDAEADLKDADDISQKLLAYLKNNLT